VNNNELQRIITSSKDIMIRSAKQLKEMKNQPHPDQELMKVIQGNYETSKRTLEIVKDMLINQAQAKSKATDNLKPNGQPATSSASSASARQKSADLKQPNKGNKTSADKQMTRGEYRRSLNK
jgi:hypothetical protein